MLQALWLLGGDQAEGSAMDADITGEDNGYNKEIPGLERWLSD